MKLTSCCVCLNHGNDQSGTEDYISIHTSLQKLEFLQIICIYAQKFERHSYVLTWMSRRHWRRRLLKAGCGHFEHFFLISHCPCRFVD